MYIIYKICIIYYILHIYYWFLYIYIYIQGLHICLFLPSDFLSRVIAPV